MRLLGHCDIGRIWLSSSSVLLMAVVVPCAAQVTGQGDAESWTLRPEMRIGSVDGPDALSLVGGVEVDARGRLFVLQPREAMIRVFDAEGRELESIGGRGGGPGEFQTPVRMGWRMDTLWVLDPSSHRISFWHDGTLAGTMRIEGVDFGTKYTLAYPIAFLEDGAFLVAAVPRTDPNGHRLARDAPVVRVGPDGARETLLAVLRATDRPVLNTPAGSRISFSYQPFDDSTVLRVSPDGKRVVLVERSAPLSGEPSSFTVLSLDAFGDTIFGRAVSYRPQRLTRDVVEGVIRIPDPALLSRYPSLAAARDAIRSAIRIPAWQPPVSEVLVGRDHTLWLRLADRGTGSVEWLVLDEQGSALGRLVLPPTLQILQAQRTQVWGVIHDEFDVPFVVRYRMEKQGSAF
jgi:hypothetical protein